jgi:CubicO group peptidase (beta-lactamase class C family)
MNMNRLEKAIETAMAHEVNWSRSPDGEPWGVHQTERPPWNRLLGPVHERGGVSGAIWRHGNPVISWGEPDRADLTFSVAKTYLALLAGVAHAQGLLPDVHEPVGARLKDIGFDDPHNSKVAWHHLLQQTSEWSGECFGIPDQVEHYRQLDFAPPTGGNKGDKRPLNAPGTYWEYNDVRINQLSLALLHLFRRPLPEVFAEFIAGPAGASDGWAWRGYDHAWVDIDGKRMQSVPGGTHWGGGMSISANDQAKIGQIMLGGGFANGRQVLPREWIEAMHTPCPVAPFYGYLVWLNEPRRIFPSVPESSYFALGAGGQYTFVQPEADLLVVVRWLDDAHAGAFFAEVLAALG